MSQDFCSRSLEPIAMRHPPGSSDHFRVLPCACVFLPSGLSACVWYLCGSSLSVSAQEDPPLSCWLLPPAVVVQLQLPVIGDCFSIDLAPSPPLMCLQSSLREALMLAEIRSPLDRTSHGTIIPFVVERSPFRGMGQLRAPHQRGSSLDRPDRAPASPKRKPDAELSVLPCASGTHCLLGEIPRSAPISSVRSVCWCQPHGAVEPLKRG